MPPHIHTYIYIICVCVCAFFSLAGWPVTLQSGTAEIFGAELPLQRPIVLVNQKIAIFTWHGAKVDTISTRASSRDQNQIG